MQVRSVIKQEVSPLHQQVIKDGGQTFSSIWSDYHRQQFRCIVRSNHAEQAEGCS